MTFAHPRLAPHSCKHLGERKLATPKFDTLCHALWMCEQYSAFPRGGRLANAGRWIGTIQGILLMNGIFSIMKLKDQNRFEPPPVPPHQH